MSAPPFILQTQKSSLSWPDAQRLKFGALNKERAGREEGVHDAARHVADVWKMAEVWKIVKKGSKPSAGRLHFKNRPCLFPGGKGTPAFFCDCRHIFLNWLNSQSRGREIVCSNSSIAADLYCDFYFYQKNSADILRFYRALLY